MRWPWSLHLRSAPVRPPVAATTTQVPSGRGSTKAASGDKGGTIALLLPETKTTRYEEQDKPRFEAKVKELCPSCKIIYQNANQDAARQQQQAEAAITNGAKVLVLDAVDAKAATATVNRAKQSNIPVIAYDRLISGAPIDYYVSFDNVRVGKIQGQALLDKLGDAAGKSIVMLNGSPTDPSSGDYKKGAHEVLDAARREDRARVRHARLEPGQGPAGDRAGDHRARQGQGRGRLLGQRRHGRRRDRGDEVGRHRPEDAPGDRPGLRGRRDPADPHRRAVHDDLPGDQEAGRVRRRSSPSTWSPARAARRLVNNKTNNGAGDVPTVLLDPTAVTKDNIKDTIIADGFHPASEICTGEFASACKEAGIS